jgi:FAD/FMN-containing dehydrogenase
MKTEKVSEKKQFKVFKALESSLGEENVSDNLAVRSAYRGTNFNVLSPWGKGPRFVVLPKTVEHVQEVVKLANRERLTILPVCLGTITAFWEADIVMDMMGMDRIIKIDTENSQVVVEPGVTYNRLDPLLRKEGYTIAIGSFPPNFSVLGNLGARRGFNHNFSARFADQTLGLEIVAADGTLLRTGTATFGIDYWSNLSQDMPDIRGLFVPTNQRAPMFGIVTKAAIRIWPMMEARGLPIGGFDSFESAMKYSQKVAKAGIADQSMVWNWVLVGILNSGMESPRKEIDFFNYVLDVNNEYNKPPKGLRYNYTWTQFRGYKEQVEVNLELCKRIAKEVGGRILEEDEIQDTIPSIAKLWRTDYRDFTPEEGELANIPSTVAPGVVDVWYFMGWVNDLIKLEQGYNRRLKEKYHGRMQAYYTRVFEGGVGGHLRYSAWTDMGDDYQAKKLMKIRDEMHTWVLENYPNIHAYFGGNRTIKNSIGMESVLDKIRSALDPNHIMYMPGEERLEPEDQESKVVGVH